MLGRGDRKTLRVTQIACSTELDMRILTGIAVGMAPHLARSMQTRPSVEPLRHPSRCAQSPTIGCLQMCMFDSRSQLSHAERLKPQSRQLKTPSMMSVEKSSGMAEEEPKCATFLAVEPHVVINLAALRLILPAPKAPLISSDFGNSSFGCSQKLGYLSSAALWPFESSLQPTPVHLYAPLPVHDQSAIYV